MKDYQTPETVTEAGSEVANRHVVNEQEPWSKVPEALTYDPTITASAIRIYSCLQRHGDSPDDCYPSHARIAKLLGMSERSVARPLGELVSAGWVTRVTRPRRNDGSRRSDAYFVHLTRAQYCADQPRDPARANRAQTRGKREPLKESVSSSSKEEEHVRARSDAQTKSSTSTANAKSLGSSFEDFWEQYPPRGRKADALKAWPAAVKAAGSAEVIVEAAKRYAADPNLPELRFVPHGVRWLKGERWNDPPLPARSTNGQTARTTPTSGPRHLEEWDMTQPSGRITL